MDIDITMLGGFAVTLTMPPWIRRTGDDATRQPWSRS